MATARKPERMITQNSHLRPEGIFTFSIPALAGKFDDGAPYVTCPAAGVCARFCYARTGTYLFPQVLAKHRRNLRRVIDDLPRWTRDRIAELAEARFRGGRYLRVHDAGDFFSDDYLRAWMTVARATPDVVLYSYTKEVSRFRRVVEPDPPTNFRWLFSYGGREDHLIRPGDRVADVFPDDAAIAAAGYHSNAGSDLLAILGPSPVGMRANNHPHLRKRIGSKSFREWQMAKKPGPAPSRRCSSRTGSQHDEQQAMPVSESGGPVVGER